MNLRILDAVDAEKAALPVKERCAMDSALAKLEALGIDLHFPHQSHIQGVPNLRELRPRAGRSAWRAFYRRAGDAIVVATIGPEANVDRQGFNHAVRTAEARLAAYVQEQHRSASDE
ncbi:MAG: type II toxin-antitoxin system RelE/ParE family toxin [Chloroflexota bacterium]